MYNLDYDQMKKLCDPSTGYYNEPEMEQPKKLLAGLERRRPMTDVSRTDDERPQRQRCET